MHVTACVWLLSLCVCVCVCVCCSLATVSCYHCCTVGRKITTEQSTMPTQLAVSSTRSAMNPVLELLQGHKTGGNIWRNLHFLAKSAFIGKVHFLLTKFNIFGNKILLTPPPIPPLSHIWDVILVWRKGNIENTVCITVLCTIVMVHKGMSSSYRVVNCIGFDLTRFIYIFFLNFCLHCSLYVLMSWASWGWPLTWLTNRHLSMLWRCWLGHQTCKVVSRMTYNVWSGTLNLTHTFWAWL